MSLLEPTGPVFSGMVLCFLGLISEGFCGTLWLFVSQCQRIVMIQSQYLSSGGGAGSGNVLYLPGSIWRQGLS
jgi:hypothetical protein